MLEQRSEPLRKPRRLIVYLGLFALAIILPALLFAGFLIQQFTSAERLANERRALETAGQIADSTDRLILDMMTTLRVLATSPALDSGEIASLHHRTKSALRGRPDHIVLLDRSLNQILNTRVPFGTPLGRTADPSSAEAVLNSKQAYVSDLFFEPVRQEYVFSVLVPVIRGGEVTHVLRMTRSVESLWEILKEQNLPQAWSATVIDREGLVIAQSKQPKQSVGTRVQNSVLQEGLHGNLATVVDWTGEPSLWAFARPRLASWLVAAEVPLKILEAPLRRSWTLFLLVGSGLVGLSLILVVFLAGRITGAMGDLARDAEALGRGAMLPRRIFPVAEANSVAEALYSAFAERKEREAHISFLLREMAHRGKNLLSVVQAIASQTARQTESSGEFVRRFSARLQSLASSSDLLVREEWRGADLRELIKSQLAPFVEIDGPRLLLNGPAVRVSAEASQSLGLALHELATNAAKHGALSVPEGKIAIEWQVTEGEGQSRFQISWREEDGPTVRAPHRRGFGHVVIERMVAQALSGQVSMEFDPKGFRWSLDAPAVSVLRQPV